jgi:hypothetical protein
MLLEEKSKNEVLFAEVEEREHAHISLMEL